jgi:hypothetical protein
MATWCVNEPPTILPVVLDGEKFSEILASIAELLYKHCCSAQLKNQDFSKTLSFGANPVSDLTTRRKRNV